MQAGGYALIPDAPDTAVEMGNALEMDEIVEMGHALELDEGPSEVDASPGMPSAPTPTPNVPAAAVPPTPVSVLRQLPKAFNGRGNWFFTWLIGNHTVRVVFSSEQGLLSSSGHRLMVFVDAGRQPVIDQRLEHER
jgi:hypothetical protein